jgi:predicted metal-dependent HD superfamily phosphohydrolase
MFERLEKYFSKTQIEEILSKYDEPWRYFHTRNHLKYILSKISIYGEKLSKENIDILYLTTLFHDAVYLPWSKTNEEDSAQLFKEYWLKDLAIVYDLTATDNILIN